MATGIQSGMGTPAPSAKAQILEFLVLTRRGCPASIPHLGPLKESDLPVSSSIFTTWSPRRIHLLHN